SSRSVRGGISNNVQTGVTMIVGTTNPSSDSRQKNCHLFLCLCLSKCAEMRAIAFVNIVRLLPNVKDEPRPWLARRVQPDDLESVVSFRDSCDSTRRDSH